MTGEQLVEKLQTLPYEAQNAEIIVVNSSGETEGFVDIVEYDEQENVIYLKQK